MIIYKDILEKLAQAGWTTYRLRREHKIGSSGIDRIRHGLPITTNMIDIICRLCHCQPGDILEYRDEE